MCHREEFAPQPRHREELATRRSSLPLVMPDLIRHPCFEDGPRVFARGDIWGDRFLSVMPDDLGADTDCF
jgi:hypothetical protein